MFTNSPIICGDSLPVMRGLPDQSYDAIITDPPYASGGLTTAERKTSPARKYISSAKYLSFESDTRDQRSHYLWSVMWMQEALRITRHGSVFRHYLKPSGKICSLQETRTRLEMHFFHTIIT